MKRSVSNIFFDFQAITYPLSFSYLKENVLNNDDKQTCFENHHHQNHSY